MLQPGVDVCDEGCSLRLGACSKPNCESRLEGQAGVEDAEQALEHRGVEAAAWIGHRRRATVTRSSNGAMRRYWGEMAAREGGEARCGVTGSDSDDVGINGNAIELGALGRRRQKKLNRRRMREMMKAKRKVEEGQCEGQEEENMDGRLKFLKRRKGEG